MQQLEIQSEIQNLALCGFGERFKPLSVSKLLDHSMWRKQHIFCFLISLPSWEKVFHNIPSTSRTCWQRPTELQEQRRKNLSNLWLLRGIHYHLDRGTKTIVQSKEKKKLNSTSAFQPQENIPVSRYSSVMSCLAQVFGN